MAQQALNGLAFTPESVRHLSRLGRLRVQPTGLGRLPHPPHVDSEEDSSVYEDKVDEYAATYHHQFHEPFFAAFLHGSLTYPETLPLVGRIKACLADNPEDRPTAKELL